MRTVFNALRYMVRAGCLENDSQRYGTVAYGNCETGHAACRLGPACLSPVGLLAAALPGVIAESVPNRTVSGIEECGAQLSQGRNLLFERVGRPDVSAAETMCSQPSEAMWASNLSGSVSLGAKFGRAASIGIVLRSRSVTGSRAARCLQRAARHNGRARRLRSTATSKREIMPESLEYDLEQILR